MQQDIFGSSDFLQSIFGPPPEAMSRVRTYQMSISAGSREIDAMDEEEAITKFLEYAVDNLLTVKISREK